MADAPTNARTADPAPGAARWAAVVVLGAAGIAGIGRAFLVPPPHPIEAFPSIVSVTAPGPESAAAGRAGDGAAPRTPSVSRMVNVNTASASELDLLPGIGPALAGRIIEFREANGPFATLDDLDEVSGIGPKTIAKLGPYAVAE